MGADSLHTRLENLCDSKRGITYGIVKVGDFVAGGVPVIRGGDIRQGRIAFDDEKRVAEEVSRRFQRTILRGGEIVINLIAEPGHTAIVPPELAGSNVSRDVGVIPLNDTVDHRYIDYCLKSPMAIRWLTSRLQGSVTQKINLSTLRELPVPTPPIEKQRAIAHILGTLDDNIDLNRRMSGTLHAIARAIFRSWFVDFDPVRQNADASFRSPRHLFPDSFEESHIGKIPRGWRLQSLDAVAHFLNGLALQRYPAASGPSLPVIKIRELNQGHTAGADQATASIPAAYIVRDGDVLFSWSGSLVVRLWSGGDGALNQHLFKVTSAKYPRWFYFMWLLEYLPDFQHIAAAKATTMGHIQRHHLGDALVPVPSDNRVIAEADRILSPLVERQLLASLESRTLAVVRDCLLPKLISGEMRVTQAERAVEAVL